MFESGRGSSAIKGLSSVRRFGAFPPLPQPARLPLTVLHWLRRASQPRKQAASQWALSGSRAVLRSARRCSIHWNPRSASAVAFCRLE